MKQGKIVLFYYENSIIHNYQVEAHKNDERRSNSAEASGFNFYCHDVHVNLIAILHER